MTILKSRFVLQRVIVCLAGLLSLPVVAWGDQPIALHPDNPHYFQWCGKPTVLITSGEHYGALLNLDFDYARYFEALAADKLNHTRTFSGVYRETAESFGITDNTLAPKPNRYICPWARSDQSGYADGGNKFDLTKWDAAYFQRLHNFMKEAKKRGIVVELTLFCPFYNDHLWDANPLHPNNNVNDTPACDREDVYTLKYDRLTKIQLAFTRKVVTELQDYDNLYWEVCNEPYFGGITMDWQHRIIDEIVEVEKGFPHQHLISLNIANKKKKVEDPHPAVSIFNFHYCVPPDTVTMNFGLNKVIGENETGFRGRYDLIYRTEGWDFILAGSALYNNLDYSFSPRHPDGTFLDYKSPGGGSPVLRQQLSILVDYLASFDFVQMKPDRSVIKQIDDKMQVQALVNEGQAYAIYVHVELPNKPKPVDYLAEVDTSLKLALPAGRYQAEWINTKSGAIDKTEKFEHHSGVKKLVSPKFVVDVVLRVQKL